MQRQIKAVPTGRLSEDDPSGWLAQSLIRGSTVNPAVNWAGCGEVVAERKAKKGLGRPVSHPEHGHTPTKRIRPLSS